MIVTASHRALRTRVYRLPDGRRVTIRHAVPSDAPRLAVVGGDEPRERDVIALDDHGAVVGRARTDEATEIATAWRGSGLAGALERELDEPE